MEGLFWVSLLLIVVIVLSLRFVGKALKAALTIGAVVCVFLLIFIVLFETTEVVVARANGEFSRIVEAGSPEFQAVIGWISDLVEGVTRFFEETVL